MKLQYPIRKVGQYVYSLKTPALGKTDKSSVFAGYQMVTQKPVAIKQINQRKMTKADKQKFLLSEIDTLHTLKSYPNIIEVYDVYETQEDHIFIVMEKCQKDLYSFIQSQGGKGLEEKRAYALMNQILKGYQGIYDNQIIHRDLKPENVFFKKDQLKIGDFGYAIKANSNDKDGLITTKENVGSPYYMSPQAFTKSSYSYKSDIWALGLIYYEIIFGQLPWNSDNELQLRKQLEKFEVTKSLPEDISYQSRKFLEGTLSRDLAQRFSPEQVLSFKFEQIKLKRNKTEKDSLGEIKYKKMNSTEEYKLDMQSIRNQKYLGLKTRQQSIGSKEESAFSQGQISPIFSPSHKSSNNSPVKDEINPQNQNPKFISLRQI